MKKSIITVAIGLVIVALIITFGQVFTVRTIDVEFENSVVSTDKQEIVTLADIDSNTNIFVLDENSIKQKIEAKFTKGEIKVADIVRKFPNHVVIKIIERIPIYKIQAHSQTKDGFVAVDKDFQRNTIYQESELEGQNLIEVSGFIINGSFESSDECKMLKKIANALINYKTDDGRSLADEGLPYLFDRIVFEGEKIKMYLKTDDVCFSLNANMDIVGEEVVGLYKNYLITLPSERGGKVFAL